MTQEKNTVRNASANNSFINYTEQPTTSNASPLHRRRQSAAELHPLFQIRFYRPPLDDNESVNSDSELFFQRRRAVTVDGGDLDNMARFLNCYQEISTNNTGNNQLENDLHLMDADDFFEMSDDSDDTLFEINDSEVFEVIFI